MNAYHCDNYILRLRSDMLEDIKKCTNPYEALPVEDLSHVTVASVAEISFYSRWLHP